MENVEYYGVCTFFYNVNIFEYLMILWVFIFNLLHDKLYKHTCHNIKRMHGCFKGPIFIIAFALSTSFHLDIKKIHNLIHLKIFFEINIIPLTFLGNSSLVFCIYNSLLTDFSAINPATVNRRYTVFGKFAMPKFSPSFFYQTDFLNKPSL